MPGHMLMSNFGIIASAEDSWEMPAGLSHEWPLALNGNDIIGTAHLTAHNITYSEGWAIFNGYNGYYDIPSGGYGMKNADWSEEIWINSNSIGRYIESIVNTSLDILRQLSFNESSISFAYRGVDTTYHYTTYSFAPSLFTDYQIIITHDHGVETKMYVNGILRATNTYAGGEDSNANIGNYLGQQSSGVSVFGGKMKKRRLWNNTILKEFDVLRLYNNGAGR